MFTGAIRVVLATALCAAPGAGDAESIASSPVQAGLPSRLAELASGFCIDVLSHKVTLPAPGLASTTFLKPYGLTEGIPQAAMTALTPSGMTLISRATLASGTVADGAFVVALGGAAGETCRIIVYKAPLSGAAVEATHTLLKTAPYSWKALPPPPQPPVAIKLSVLKRDVKGQPFLANILAPYAPSPVAMTLTVAAIPSYVTVPQGY